LRPTRCAVAGATRREAERAKQAPTQDFHWYHTSRHPQPVRQVSNIPSYTSQTTFSADKVWPHRGHGNPPRSASCWISASAVVAMSSGRGSTKTGSVSVSGIYLIAYYKSPLECRSTRAIPPQGFGGSAIRSHRAPQAVRLVADHRGEFLTLAAANAPIQLPGLWLFIPTQRVDNKHRRVTL
jgi:hypothetical protein